MSELASNLESLRVRDIEGQCCTSGHRVKWLKNKGAILIVVWNHLALSVYGLLRIGYKDKLEEDYVSSIGLILIGSTLLYPIGGWLADTRLGRYAVIRYNMWIMWIGSLLLTFNEVLSSVSVVYSTARWPVFATLSIVMAIALGGFLSNIVQLGIDQLSDASATEITSFITWYTVTFFTSKLTFHYISDCIHTLYVKPFIVAVCLSVALCSNFLFQHWLVKEHVAGNSLRTILNVVKYTIKNRKFKHNYSNEYESLSSFDIAKHRYGGPFTAQQVENVRTFLWLIFIIAVFAVLGGVPIPITYAQDKMMRQIIDSHGCSGQLIVFGFESIVVVAVIFLFEIILLPFLSKYLISKVSTTTMFTLGAIGTLLWVISLLIIEVVAYEEKLHPAGSCVFNHSEASKLNFKWFFIPKSFSGLATYLLILSALKFVWAQSPSTMKGMIFGFVYTCLGLSSLLHTAIATPFIFHKHITVSWEHIKLTYIVFGIC